MLAGPRDGRGGEIARHRAEKGIVWIKWIGTHKDYDKIDVKEVQHDG